ncbi:protein FAM161A-like [Alosa sapidissima]|uniref:protein FAM161A-like n=1 Tax=Alosa sapidissima TaxID=34773 RepID=UPI001C08185F|nr:protein FAM161A-like [Alosa sapidissima]
MWLPHRNASIRHNCLHSPVKYDNDKNVVCREMPPPGPHDVYYMTLKTPCYVDIRQPKYNPLAYITIDPFDNYEALQDTKSKETTRGFQEKGPGRIMVLSEEKWWNDEKDKDNEADTVSTSGDMETGTLAWMWEGFSVDDYNPKPRPMTVIPKAVESKPRVTVPEPFQMTLREAEKRRKSRRAWEEVRVEPQKPPQFKANPIPRSARVCLYDKMVQGCERQRQIVHEKRMAFLKAMQCSFSVGDAKSTKRAPAVSTEKPTFRPAINPTVPDFTKLHHTFEDRLKHVRQKRPPTVPQPFSFQASALGDHQQTTNSMVKEPLKTTKWQDDTKRSVDQCTKARARSPRHTKAALLREGAVRKKLTSEAAKQMEYENQKSDTRTRLQKEVGLWITAQKCYTSANEKRKQYYRRELQARSAEYRAELAEMKERVNRRPLMLQSLYDPAMQDHNSCLILEHKVLDDFLRWNQAQTRAISFK